MGPLKTGFTRIWAPTGCFRQHTLEYLFNDLFQWARWGTWHRKSSSFWRKIEHTTGV